MSELQPDITSDLANQVYALTKTEDIKRAIGLLNISFKDEFEFSESSMLKGKSGGPWKIKCRTAFGFVLIGKGKYAGHAVFLFRGTQYLADWLTNLNVGVSRSVSGFPVHDGFHTAFQSMKPQLKEYMADVTKQKIINIHCVGHSLGGALATICADWIRSAYNRSPYLYTYGSPRVGLQDFAAHCTHNLGSKKIFRVYHSTDIVPCIPIWPYYHTPYQTQDYWIHSPGFLPTAEYHDMAKYVKSVTGKPWPVLASLREQHTKFSILQWLKSQTVSGFTMKTLELLNRAIVY
ncbi:MAG: lipase family protein, partial [Cellvibrio sp.]